MSDPILERLRALTREEKLAIFAEGVEKTRERRVLSTAAQPSDGSKVIRLRLSGGRSLAYRLSADDLAL